MKFSRCILFIILFLLTDIFIGQARTTPDALESRGPRRDDLGEILDQFNLPYINNGGLAWDGEYLWGVTRANNRRLFCFDPRNDFEVIEDFNINQSDAIGMTWDPVDGVFWVCEHDVNQSRAFLYDRNGEQVDEIELPRGGHHGLAWDGEFFYAHSENSQQNPRIFKLDRDGRVVDEGPNLAAAINHGRAVSIEWVGAHDDGHFWVMSTGYISQLAIDFDNNEVEIIREFDSRNDDYPHQGITHDGYNLIAGGNWREQLGFIYDDAIEEAYGVLGIDREIFWFGPVPAGNTAEQTLRLSNLSEDEGDQYILEFELIDLGEDPNWLSFEPANGEINPGEFTDIEFLATTADLDLGEYERIVRIVSNASNVGDVDLTLTMIVVGGVGHLFGTVTDPAEEDRPIANALVQVVADFEMQQITDDEGRYDFGETPVFNYHLRCTHENYLPMEAENVEVNANEETEQNFAMLYGEFRCDPGQILQSMSPNEELQVPITISNRGNGPIGWSLERVFPEQVEFDPWELRESVNIEESLNDDRLNGAVFANGNFFITGGNYNYEDINKVYVLNSDGEHVRDFDQFNESRHGIRDITWDGRLLWGGDGDILYGFTTGGELVTSMETDAPSLRSITWDPDRDLFWTADITSNIIGIDANGDQQAVIDRPEDLRTYGLAYWTEDPDGYNLYAFARGVETDLQIFRIDPDNGEMMTAAHIDFIEGCRPSSISVTNRYDPYSWVMVSIIQTPDHLAIWHLDSRTDWIAVEPVDGVLEARENNDLTVTLNSEGMPPATDLSVDLVITHDGRGGHFELPVTMSVTQEGGIAQRLLNLRLGWNLVSVNVEPEIDNIRELMSPLVDEGLLYLMKDQDGNFYIPAYDFNNIDRWNGVQGYQLLTNRAEFTIEGEVIPWDTAIDLREGWSIVSYLPRQPVDAVVALSRILEVLVIVKDGRGNFHIPEWNFSNLGLMREGWGYFVNVSEATELIYNLGQGERASSSHLLSAADVSWIYEIRPTCTSYSLLLITERMSSGTRIEAYTQSGFPSGRGIVDSDGRCGMALWGDDPTTDEIDGFCEGEKPEIRIHAGKDFTEEHLSGCPFPDWTADGFGVVNVSVGSIPVEFGLKSAYPNPFNSTIVISFAVNSSERTTLRVFDITGREVATIVDAEHTAGIQTTIWNAEGLPSGVYIVKLNSGNRSQFSKVILLR